MSKRSSLTQALRHASGKTEAPVAESLPLPTVKAAKSPGRRGKKPVAAFFDPAVSRQLKQIALEEGSNLQELLREAINALFESRGKGRIA